MPVITISRQYGSLGDEIGRDVAERLGLRFVDHDVISEVARRLDLPTATIDELDERRGHLVSDLVKTMRQLYPATRLPQSPEGNPNLDEAMYLQVIRQVIWEVARGNDAVIVGRGSPFILPKHPDVLHVLVVAPTDVRVERIMARDGLEQSRAEHQLREVDASRGRYIRHFYRTNWLDFDHYDLVINTGHFTQLRAAELIVAAAAPQAPASGSEAANAGGSPPISPEP